MCMNWRTCLCWRDTKSPTIAIVVFALVTSLLQILVQVAVFSGYFGGNPYAQGIWNSSGGVVMKLYIALAVFDFFVVLFSIMMLVGIERADWYRCSVILWIIWIIFYILYESAINIYYFYLELSNSNTYVFTNSVGYLIVPLIYWVCKEIILFVGWLFIVSNQCYSDDLMVKNYDSTLQLVDTIPSAHTCSLGARDALGPIYYSGGVAQVQIRDNPRSAVSHFDVVRPTSSCQVYSPNWSRASGGYLGRDSGIYGPPRYM